jgi:hypothetical protein
VPCGDWAEYRRLRGEHASHGSGIVSARAAECPKPRECVLAHVCRRIARRRSLRVIVAWSNTRLTTRLTASSAAGPEARNSKRAFAVANPFPSCPPPRATIAPPGGPRQEGLARLGRGAPSTTRPSWRDVERGRRPNAGGRRDSRRTRGLKSACLTGAFSANQRKQPSDTGSLLIVNHAGKARRPIRASAAQTTLTLTG